MITRTKSIVVIYVLREKILYLLIAAAVLYFSEKVYKVNTYKSKLIVLIPMVIVVGNGFSYPISNPGCDTTCSSVLNM